MSPPPPIPDIISLKSVLPEYIVFAVKLPLTYMFPFIVPPVTLTKESEPISKTSEPSKDHSFLSAVLIASSPCLIKWLSFFVVPVGCRPGTEVFLGITRLFLSTIVFNYRIKINISTLIEAKKSYFFINRKNFIKYFFFIIFIRNKKNI